MQHGKKWSREKKKTVQGEDTRDWTNAAREILYYRKEISIGGEAYGGWHILEG